jgi:hypothetical protein
VIETFQSIVLTTGSATPTIREQHMCSTPRQKPQAGGLGRYFDKGQIPGGFQVRHGLVQDKSQAQMNLRRLMWADEVDR